MTPITTALIYTRVSSDEQAREGLSLDVQLAASRRYAARPGWVIGREFQDILSGRRDDRPDYQALLAECRRLRSEGRSVAVVVARLDRFGRRLLERVQRREEFKALGVVVHSVREGEVNDMVAGFLALMAEDEVRRLGERVADSRQYVAARGWQPVGRPTWGFRFRPATDEERALGSPKAVLEVDPICEPFVRELFERVAAGEAIRTVATWATSLPEAVRGGRALTYQTIRCILRGLVYGGRVDYPGLDPSDHPVGHWPAIVDEATWQRVQERIADHRRTPRQRSGKYLLTGLLRCSRCGCRMHGVTKRPVGHRAYICDDERGADAGRNCRFQVTTRLVDDPVLDEVGALLSAIAMTDSTLQAALERAWRELGRPSGAATDRRQIATLEREANKARKRLTNAAVLLVDGTIDKAGYDRLRDKAQADLDRAEAALAQLRGVVEATPTLPPLAAVLEQLGGWTAALRTGDPAEQHEALKPLVERILPHRVRKGAYRAEIVWTPLGEALHHAATTLAHQPAA